MPPAAVDTTADVAVDASARAAADPAPRPTNQPLDFPDARFDAFRRTDRYGPMGRTPQPFLEYVRLALAAVTVLPIKVVVTLSAIVAFYVVCRLQCLLGRPGFGGRRAAAVAALGSACARWALFGYGFTAVRHERLAYVAGTGPTGGGGGGGGPPPRPGAIVSNHLGYLDVLVHMALTFPSFVARGATKDLTMVGVISQAMSCLYVDRTKAAGAAGIAAAVRDRVADAAAGKARPMVLFPEGTTTNGRFLLPFKTGAFLAGAPVRPVVLAYDRTRVSPAWETISAPRHILLMLLQPAHGVTAYELPVWVPNDEERGDPALFADRVRRAMLAAGDFSPLDASLADKWEYQALLKGAGPEEAAAARVGGPKAGTKVKAA